MDKILYLKLLDSVSSNIKNNICTYIYNHAALAAQGTDQKRRDREEDREWRASRLGPRSVRDDKADKYLRDKPASALKLPDDGISELSVQRFQPE